MYYIASWIGAVSCYTSQQYANRFVTIKRFFFFRNELEIYRLRSIPMERTFRFVASDCLRRGRHQGACGSGLFNRVDCNSIEFLQSSLVISVKSIRIFDQSLIIFNSYPFRTLEINLDIFSLSTDERNNNPFVVVQNRSRRFFFVFQHSSSILPCSI